MPLQKISSLNLNRNSGNGVFSGPKGHILLIKDMKKNIWEPVGFTDDDNYAEKFVEAL